MDKSGIELLLIDLCARLPYRVILSVTLKNKYDEIVNRNVELTEYNLGYITKASHWQEYKPYLRPMSSMTEEEEKEYEHLVAWHNAHHFDYRGLIERGLALKASEGMYKF